MPDQVIRPKSGHLHEPMTLLAWVAGITRRIELVPSVIVSPSRQTALLAKQAAEIEQRLGDSQRKIQIAGINQALGQILMDESRSLPDTSVLRWRAAEREREIAEIAGLEAAYPPDEACCAEARKLIASELDGGRWQQQAYLKASNADRDDRFGWSVAVDGDLIVVGAPEEDGGGAGVGAPESDNSASNAGAAYVFERNQGGADAWGQVVKLTPSDGESYDRFGSEVAIDSDLIVVGAPTVMIG